MLIDLDVSKLSYINQCIFVIGRLAQLVEHLVYTEGVKGSSPLLPTKIVICGGVAQLVRAIACHAIGRGFESLHSRHNMIMILNFLNSVNKLGIKNVTNLHYKYLQKQLYKTTI